MAKKQDEQPKAAAQDFIGEDGRPQPHAVESEQGAAPGPLVGPTPTPETVEVNEAGQVFATKEITPPADPRAETPQNQYQPKQLPVSEEDTEGYEDSVDVRQ